MPPARERERDLVRIVELAAIAHAVIDAVRAEQADVLAAVLEAGLGVGARALLVRLAGAAIGTAEDRRRRRSSPPTHCWSAKPW